MRAEEYTYDLPDGYEMKASTRKELDIFVENTKLTNIQAQKMVDLHVELVEEYAGLMKTAMSGAIVATAVATFIITATIATAIIIFYP